MAKSIAWEPLKALMADFRKYGLIQKENDSELLIKFAGRTIQLKGADEPDSLRGIGPNFLVLDEYAVMKSAVWDEVLRPSVADKSGRAVFISTPKGYNHFHRLYLQGQTEPTIWKSYHFKTSDNPTIPRKEIEQARRDMDTRAFRQEFEASFEVFGGQVFPDFLRERHASKPIAFNELWEYDIGMDFGWAAPTTALLINVDPKDNVYVFAEYAARETPIQVIAAKLKEIPPKPTHSATLIPNMIYCDPAGDSKNEAMGISTVGELRNIFGHSHVQYKKNYPGIIVDGITIMRQWMRNGKLFIDPGCTHLIQALEMYRYPDPKGDIRSEIPLKDGISDHWNDALRYFFLNRFPLQKTEWRAL
jgi:phage terminase large subunit